MKPKRIRFAVSFLLPKGATVAEARTYLARALDRGHVGASWTLDGHDPMFALDQGSIKIKRLGPIKSRKPL